MSTGSEIEARTFAESRRTLLDALDRTEEEARDQAAELIRAAERRARKVTLQADQCAGLIEEQLTYLSSQLDQVRARVTAIRSRIAHELDGEPVMRLGHSTSQAIREPRETTAIEFAPAASAVPEPRPQIDVSGTDGDSLPETLRVLRAALDSLNGQSPSESSSQKH